MTQNGIEHILRSNPQIPVATIHSEEELLKIMAKIQDANIHCIEVTLRTEYAYGALRAIKAMNIPNFSVGVGTVIRKEQVDEVKAIGVDFIVSPGLTEKLATELHASGIAFIPGVSTVSEIMIGLELDCTFFKFFPANLSGGVEALKAYGQLFPQVKFCPTGGITQATYMDYLNEKNILSVGGSWMLK
ncbi:MAG: bifunctional 4-hydroxy-2-oxoglutarate aldolase/2-dehydro-3-deoxy-phosphogluconate aldolase [Crocinitomicaceae bacterium]|nr:bifunctional 4-hydroxy-2-oxoglutarate aldolase/2-dehydro-3-deoxy-phosphogluconate aldolase [Crocinitomicaceae bacterium]